MHLPWDRNYFKLCFYAVFAFVLGYVLKLGIDALAYTIANVDDIYTGATQNLLKVLSVFSVLIWGFVLAYILDPVVDFFQNIYNKIFNKKSGDIRREGAMITYFVIIVIISIAIWLLGLKVSGAGGGNFAESISIQVKHYTDEASKLYYKLEKYLVEFGIYEYIKGYMADITAWLSSFLAGLGEGVVGAVATVGSSIINILLSVVIAFYFLKDKNVIKNKMLYFFETVLPQRANGRMTMLAQDINLVFSGYIRGQLTDALIMAVLISLGLSILRIRLSILIGIVSGFSNIIPYFGALMGFVLAVGMAILSGEPTKAIYAGVMMLVLQQIDSAVIVPKVVGESVELSPVMVIIALAVAGKLFGLWGMVLAVPVVAVIKIFACRIYKRIERKKGINTNRL